MAGMLELPPDLEQQIREEATKKEYEMASPLPKRIAGLNRGQVLWISDDFDAPLPDNFWLGDLP